MKSITMHDIIIGNQISYTWSCIMHKHKLVINWFFLKINLISISANSCHKKQLIESLNRTCWYMWQDQGEWVTCRQYSILIFQFKSLVCLKCYILIQIPSQSDIWLQRYEQFFKFKNNIKHKKLSSLLACNSKSIFPTTDSFPLIMSHMKLHWRLSVSRQLGYLVVLLNVRYMRYLNTFGQTLRIKLYQNQLHESDRDRTTHPPPFNFREQVWFSAIFHYFGWQPPPPFWKNKIWICSLAGTSVYRLQYVQNLTHQCEKCNQFY